MKEVMSLQKGAFTVSLCFTSIVGTVKYNLLFINAECGRNPPKEVFSYSREGVPIMALIEKTAAT
jgi:hypothetical protein